MGTSQSSSPVISLLIVEDDKIPREVTFLMVSKKLPEVTCYAAENGEIGFELFKEHTPDIVITDINMPGMDGIRMASVIREIKADTRFIVLTGFSDDMHLKELSEMGISDYIVKPVEFAKLFALIEKCIAEVKLQRQ